jgi:hypothetical protein
MADRKPQRKNPMAILWASAHRNVLTQVARECKCTPQFVHYCLYGLRKSKDGKVERMLREQGAPVVWKP